MSLILKRSPNDYDQNFPAKKTRGGSVSPNLGSYNEHNLWQTTFLDNLFRESFRTSVLPKYAISLGETTFSGGNLLQFEYEFQTMGWTHMKTIVLDHHQYVVQEPALSYSDPLTYPAINKNMPSITGQGTCRFLDDIYRISVKIGDNDFEVCNPTSSTSPYLKINVLGEARTPLERKILAQFGIFYERHVSRWHDPGLLGNQLPRNDSYNLNVPNNTHSNAAAFDVESLGAEADIYDAFTHYLMRWEAGSSQQKKISAIPLYMLVPFFNQNAYLPPQFKIKIALTLAQEASSLGGPPPVISRFGTNEILLSDGQGEAVRKSTTEPIRPVDNAIRYMYKLIPDAANEHVNKLWKNIPLNYAFKDFRVFSKDILGVGTWNACIERDSNLPCDIYFQCMNFKNQINEPTWNWNIEKCAARKWIYNGFFCSNKHGNLATAIVERFKIYVNNEVVRDLHFNKDELVYGPNCPQRTADDILEMLKDKRTNKHGTDSTTCISENSSYFKIHLDENDFQNKKYIKMNKRAKNVIKIEIVVGTMGKQTSVDTGYPLLVYNNYSYQTGKEQTHFTEEFTQNVTTNNKMVIYFKEQNFAIIDSEKTVKQTQSPNYYGRSK
jgi:hypothetical protein